MADVVAVEYVGHAPAFGQGVFCGECDGAFARAGQAGEPYKCAFLFEQVFALFACDMAFVPDDVGGFDFGQEIPPVFLVMVKMRFGCFKIPNFE